jgi:hypothetical protein
MKFDCEMIVSVPHDHEGGKDHNYCLDNKREQFLYHIGLLLQEMYGLFKICQA